MTTGIRCVAQRWTRTSFPIITLVVYGSPLRGDDIGVNCLTSLPLASRIALVTGASRGIGYATARALAKAGAHVVAVARTQAGLEELDDDIRRDGGSATLVPINLIDFEGVARLGAALNERHGKLDILIGNAGVAGPSSPLGHIELKPWNDVMAVNVRQTFS